MKKLTDNQHKKVLIKILDAFHKYCIEHGIKYSLIGGSLIGAVREGGIIPWDDDIDVILMPEEYEKLLDSLKNDPFSYRMVSYETDEDYYNPAFKFVDDNTLIVEDGQKRSYGAFLDVFRYNYIPDGMLAKKIFYFLFRLKLVTIHGFSPRAKKDSLSKKIRALYSRMKSPKKYIKKYDDFLCRHNKKSTQSVISNGTMYSLQRETMRSEWLREYRNVDFGGIKAMIFSHYNEILKTTFGDYMTPPPEEKRINKHGIITYQK